MKWRNTLSVFCDGKPTVKLKVQIYWIGMAIKPTVIYSECWAVTCQQEQEIGVVDYGYENVEVDKGAEKMIWWEINVSRQNLE